jgi:hypothetical protein
MPTGAPTPTGRSVLPRQLLTHTEPGAIRVMAPQTRDAIHRLFLLAIGIVMALTLSTASASAGNSEGATGLTGCNDLNIMEASNSTFSYFRSALETAMFNAVAWNNTNNVNPTDLVVVAHTSNTTSTDGVFFDGDYSAFCGKTWHPAGSTIGMAKCNNLVSGLQHCDRHYAYFDTSAVNSTSFDLVRERRLACHETGHIFHSYRLNLS